MNMIGLLLGVVTAISLLVSGCQPAPADQLERARKAMGSQSNLPKVEINQTALSGNWFSACARDVERSEFFRMDQLSITSNYVDYSSEFFSDSNCTQKSFLQSLTGFYTLEGEKMTISYANFNMLPEASIIVAAFNSGSFCGANDWEIGKIKTQTDLSACGYDANLITKVARYGNSELFLGDKKFVRN